MPRRLPGLAIGAVLQLAALVLAHELVFVVRYGSRYGEELVHSGHGEAWNAAVLTSAALALGLAGIAVARLARLGLLARRHSTAGTAGDWREGGALHRTWLRAAPRMAVLSVLLLTVQENVERGAIGQQMPGPGVLLSPEYPAALWITIAVALVVSFVASLVEWRRKVLLARLRRAREPLPRGAAGATRRPARTYTRPVGSLLGRRSALRAPPQAPVAA